jgi:hypothetical protein
MHVAYCDSYTCLFEYFREKTRSMQLNKLFSVILEEVL